MNAAAAAATTLVVLALGAGAYVIGSPADARVYRMDQRRVDDLRQLSYAMSAYWTTHKALPPSLDSLPSDGWSSARLRDPETGTAYELTLVQDSTYSLCATFRRASEDDGQAFRDRWFHPAGRQCFALMATAGDTPNPRP
jgi:hypothetical protein